MPPAKPRIALICMECGTVFHRLECQITRGRGRFCSKACLGASKRHGSWVDCAACGGRFYRRFGEQGGAINQFCSWDCMMRWRALERGPNSYVKVSGRHEHRVVAERVLGRKLSSVEVVHHIDEDRHNNDPANLAVFPNQTYHARCHAGGMSDEELRGFSLIQEAGS